MPVISQLVNNLQPGITAAVSSDIFRKTGRLNIIFVMHSSNDRFLVIDDPEVRMTL